MAQQLALFKRRDGDALVALGKMLSMDIFVDDELPSSDAVAPLAAASSTDAALGTAGTAAADLSPAQPVLPAAPTGVASPSGPVPSGQVNAADARAFLVSSRNSSARDVASYNAAAAKPAAPYSAAARLYDFQGLPSLDAFRHPKGKKPKGFHMTHTVVWPELRVALSPQHRERISDLYHSLSDNRKRAISVTDPDLLCYRPEGTPPPANALAEAKRRPQERAVGALRILAGFMRKGRACDGEEPEAVSATQAGTGSASATVTAGATC